nr:MAG: P0 protein [Polerovirus monocotyledonae 1]
MFVVDSLGIASVQHYTVTPPIRDRIVWLVEHILFANNVCSYVSEVSFRIRFCCSMLFVLPLLFIEGVEFRRSRVITLPQRHYIAVLRYGLALGWMPSIRIRNGKLQIRLSKVSPSYHYRFLLQRALISSFGEELGRHPDAFARGRNDFLNLLGAVVHRVEALPTLDSCVHPVDIGYCLDVLSYGGHAFHMVRFDELYIPRAYRFIVLCFHSLHLSGRSLDILQATDFYDHMAYENVLEGSAIQEILKL